MPVKLFSERFEEVPRGKIHLEDAQEMLNLHRAAIPSNRIDANAASKIYRDDAGHCDKKIIHVQHGS